ncbi:hypothetical protein [Dietzia sp. ANT_WB102]|uniref:hypothetical protein n=1 Tax=Dietzia sp. ANT_WB102 TaxID=2597345 RepID=UPI0011EC38FA|nr:hypothetical protein [Dietzia sp. ANT_WB102]KAA0917303.1 hypothetical protein FQ137_14020 [Dietzia sp. ANT_WB102]
MSKFLTYAGSLATALLVVSAGSAAAQGSGAAGSNSVPGSMESKGGFLGQVGELAPASVTGSLPGYATGPLGSAATLICNVGSAAGAAATVMGAPMQVPVGIICMALNPAAESADALLQGDVEGSVSAVLAGVPLVGASLEGQVDTGSATESVEGSVGERLGSLAETSLSPQN